MAETYSDDLFANYEALREDRAWSPEMMAASIETSDPVLAGRYRERFAMDVGSKAPTKRRSKADAEQTEV